jgi:hypothetical protein
MGPRGDLVDVQASMARMRRSRSPVATCTESNDKITKKEEVEAREEPTNDLRNQIQQREVVMGVTDGRMLFC